MWQDSDDGVEGERTQHSVSPVQSVPRDLHFLSLEEE
jgi:hypothetical protein